MTHSFPTRRSSDLPAASRYKCAGGRESLLRRAPRLVTGGRIRGRSPWRSSGQATSCLHREGRRGREWALSACSFAPEPPDIRRSEEHTSELQSLMRISYAVFCLKQKTHKNTNT